MTEQKFSYSKLNTFESCGFKYKLTYEDGNFFFTDSLASELGTLIHKTLEDIAFELKHGRTPDYNKIKKELLEYNIPKKDKFDTEGGIYGINILKEKYKEEFYKTDESGTSYYTRVLDYMSYGIYRLENFLKNNPDIVVYDMEKYFNVDFNGHILNGYIDRILYDTKNDIYIVEDIKTKNKAFKQEELATPLQFVVYVYALAKSMNLPYSKFKCAYDLPFLDMRQEAGTKGFMERGIKKLNEIFDSIEHKDFKANATPLCHWCSYCPTNETAPEKAKGLCPYYSLWTRENKTHQVSHKWRGLEYYEIDLEDERQKNLEKGTAVEVDSEEFDF